MSIHVTRTRDVRTRNMHNWRTYTHSSIVFTTIRLLSAIIYARVGTPCVKRFDETVGVSGSTLSIPFHRMFDTAVWKNMLVRAYNVSWETRNYSTAPWKFRKDFHAQCFALVSFDDLSPSENKTVYALLNKVTPKYESVGLELSSASSQKPLRTYRATPFSVLFSVLGRDQVDLKVFSHKHRTNTLLIRAEHLSNRNMPT